MRRTNLILSVSFHSSFKLAHSCQEKPKLHTNSLNKLLLVPQATLRRRAQNRNNKAKDTSKGLGRYSTTFDEESENELVNHILSLE
jgi:hypothetical protein